MFLDDDVISRWNDVTIFEQLPSLLCHVEVFYFPRTSKVLKMNQPLNKPSNRNKGLKRRDIIETYLPSLYPGFFPPVLCTNNHPVPSQRTACKGGFHQDQGAYFWPQCEP